MFVLWAGACFAAPAVFARGLTVVNLDGSISVPEPAMMPAATEAHSVKAAGGAHHVDSSTAPAHLLDIAFEADVVYDSTTFSVSDMKKNFSVAASSNSSYGYYEITLKAAGGSDTFTVARTSLKEEKYSIQGNEVNMVAECDKGQCVVYGNVPTPDSSDMLTVTFTDNKRDLTVSGQYYNLSLFADKMVGAAASSALTNADIALLCAFSAAYHMDAATPPDGWKPAELPKWAHVPGNWDAQHPNPWLHELVPHDVVPPGGSPSNGGNHGGGAGGHGGGGHGGHGGHGGAGGPGDGDDSGDGSGGGHHKGGHHGGGGGGFGGGGDGGGGWSGGGGGGRHGGRHSDGGGNFGGDSGGFGGGGGSGYAPGGRHRGGGAAMSGQDGGPEDSGGGGGSYAGGSSRHNSKSGDASSGYGGHSGSSGAGGNGGDMLASSRGRGHGSDGGGGGGGDNGGGDGSVSGFPIGKEEGAVPDHATTPITERGGRHPGKNKVASVANSKAGIAVAIPAAFNAFVKPSVRKATVAEMETVAPEFLSASAYTARKAVGKIYSAVKVSKPTEETIDNISMPVASSPVLVTAAATATAAATSGLFHTMLPLLLRRRAVLKVLLRPRKPF